MRNLERAEDISRAAMQAGIKWRWETFPQFLDVLDALPKGINYAGYIGPLRAAHLCDGPARLHRRGDRGRSQGDGASHAGGDRRRRASASRPRARVSHQTSDDKPVASRLATWDEFETLVQGDGRRHGRGRGRAARRRQREGAAVLRGPRASSPSRAAGRSPSACSTGAPVPGTGAPPSTSSSAPPARRPHVRPGAQPGAERAALLRDPAAVRQVGDVARHAQAAARRAEAVAARRRQAAQAGRDRLASPYEGPEVRGGGEADRRNGTGSSR